MPFVAEEKLLDNPDALLITSKNSSAPFLIAYNKEDLASRINVPGKDTLWLR